LCALSSKHETKVGDVEGKVTAPPSAPLNRSGGDDTHTHTKQTTNKQHNKNIARKQLTQKNNLVPIVHVFACGPSITFAYAVVGRLFCEVIGFTALNFFTIQIEIEAIVDTSFLGVVAAGLVEGVFSVHCCSTHTHPHSTDRMSIRPPTALLYLDWV
jgi:hypothetical protein